MAWTFVNGAEVASGTNSQTIAKPAGVAVGDALIYVTRTNTSQLAASTGGLFTEVSQIVSGQTRIQTWFRVVDGSEAATFGFTTTGTSSTFFITGIAVRPPSSSPVVDVFSTANNAASTQLCAPSITPTQSDDCLIWSSMIQSTGSGYTPPAGFTTPAGADITSTFRLLMAYNLSVGASATGDLVGSVSGSVANFTGVVALKLLNPPVIASLGVATASAASPQITATTGARASLGVANTSSAAPQTAATGVVVVNATASLGVASASSAAQPITATGVIAVSATASLGVASSNSAAQPIASLSGSLASLGVTSASTSAPQITTATGATAALGAAPTATAACQITTATGVVASLGVTGIITGASPTLYARGSPPHAVHVATEGATQTADGSIKTLAVPVPAGTAAGDLLVVWIASGGGGPWITPSGWQIDAPTGDANRRLYSRIAGASEPASYTFTQTNPLAGRAHGIMSAFRPPSGMTLAFDTNGLQANSTSTTTPTLPAVLTTRATDLLVMAGGANGTTTWDKPIPFWVLPTNGQRAFGPTIALMHNVDAGAAGTTPVQTATWSPAATGDINVVAYKLVSEVTTAALGLASSTSQARQIAGPVGSVASLGLTTTAAGTPTPLYARGSPPNATHVVTENATQLGNGSIKTLTIPVPSAAAVGDLMVVWIAGGGGGPWLSPPPGWQIDGPTSDGNRRVFSHIVGASEPASYTFTQTNPIFNQAYGIVSVFRPPAGLALAFDTYGVQANSTSTLTPTLPSVLTTQDTDLLVMAGGANAGTFWRPPVPFWVMPTTGHLEPNPSLALMHNLDAGPAGVTPVQTATWELPATGDVIVVAYKLTNPPVLAVLGQTTTTASEQVITAKGGANAALGAAQVTAQARQIVSVAVGISSFDSADASASAPPITAAVGTTAVLDPAVSTGYAPAPGTITGADVTLSTATTLAQAESLTIITGAVAILEIASADSDVTTIEIPFSIPPTVVSLGVASAVSEALRIIAIAGSAPVAHVFLAGRTVDQVLIATRREPVFAAPRRVPHPFASQRVLMVIRATRLASDANVIRAFRSQMEDLL